jgi:hypothetical protein
VDANRKTTGMTFFRQGIKNEDLKVRSAFWDETSRPVPGCFSWDEEGRMRDSDTGFQTSEVEGENQLREVGDPCLGLVPGFWIELTFA